MKRFFAAAAAGLAFLAVSGVARAQDATADTNHWSGDYGQHNTRRSDFTAGVTLGLLAGDAVGYPNEIGKLNNPDYRASTGIGVGSGTMIWLGGALKDWLTLGVGASFIRFKGGGLAASGGGALFRVEAYPLFYQGGPWRDLGFVGNFGIGGMGLAEGNDTRADGGSMSLVGAGAFWEGLRAGHFAFGPGLEYQRLFSQSLHMDSVLASFRVAVYGGP